MAFLVGSRIPNHTKCSEARFLHPDIFRQRVSLSSSWRTCNENLQRRKKGGPLLSYDHCPVDNCEFKTYHKDRMEKHKKHKHSNDPQKKLVACDGCGYMTNVKSRMMRLQMENQEKLLADCEAKLARKDQVFCFYRYISPFNTLLISGEPEPQGGKQEAGANHQRPVQRQPPVMPTKKRLRQAKKLDSCQLS